MSEAKEAAPVLALIRDMIFASRVRGTAEALGIPIVMVRVAAELEAAARASNPRLIMIDLEDRGTDTGALIAGLKQDPELRTIPLVGFASHVNRDGIERAREAGADRVLARSAFVRELPDLLGGRV